MEELERENSALQADMQRRDGAGSVRTAVVELAARVCEVVRAKAQGDLPPPNNIQPVLDVIEPRYKAFTLLMQHVAFHMLCICRLMHRQRNAWHFILTFILTCECADMQGQVGGGNARARCKG